MPPPAARPGRGQRPNADPDGTGGWGEGHKEQAGPLPSAEGLCGVHRAEREGEVKGKYEDIGIAEIKYKVNDINAGVQGGRRRGLPAPEEHRQHQGTPERQIRLIIFIVKLKNIIFV